MIQLKRRTDQLVDYFSYKLTCGMFAMKPKSFDEWLAWTRSDEYRYERWLAKFVPFEDECSCEDE
jgi:hypothetical protein